MERRSDDLWIFVGRGRYWALIAFLSVWLCLWFVGEVAVLAVLVARLLGREAGEDAPLLFLLVWLAGWTVGGVAAWAVFLNLLFRREAIYVSRSLLVKQTRMLWWKRETLVDLADVDEFRVTSPSQYPKDWGRRRLDSDSDLRGIAVQYLGYQVLLLVSESGEGKKASEESIVDRTREALEAFRIPVTPLPEKPVLSPMNQIREAFEGIRELVSADAEEEAEKERGAAAVRPIGVEPTSDVLRRWASQILLAILVIIGWGFWVRTGGVPSVFAMLFLGYGILFSLTLLITTIRGIRRVGRGKRWSPPLKGTWKEEWGALPAILIVSLFLGGVTWLALLNVSSKELGKWDAVRRHVYSFGEERTRKTDAQGNRYVGRMMLSLPPRLHKYGPDGRFRWAITVPALGDPYGTLDLREDGSFQVRTESVTEEYDRNGWFVGGDRPRVLP